MYSACWIYRRESLAHNNIQEEVIRESKNRVQSMALLHNKLSYSNANDSVNFEEYLHELVALIQMAYFNPKKQISIQVNCDVKQLDIDTGIPLRLVMVELLSNSFKTCFYQKGNWQYSDQCNPGYSSWQKAAGV